MVGTKQYLKRVQDGITSIDELRHQAHFYDKLFLVWLLTKGYSSYIFKLLVSVVFRRLTMARAMQLLSAADHMQAGYIESREAEFSADIDRPEDFQMLLGIPLAGCRLTDSASRLVPFLACGAQTCHSEPMLPF